MALFDYRSAACGMVMALTLAVAAADAKTVLDPGLWQDTETGTENGQPVKPQVTTDCMSAKDAEDPEKALTEMKNSAGQQCSKMEVHRSGNSFSIDMRCGDSKQFSMDMAASYTIHDRRHYSARIKSTVILGGRKIPSDKQVESKWIGVCKK
jgi:Protein of unknown function (DUF3617)